MRQENASVFENSREERRNLRLEKRQCHTGGVVWGLFLILLGSLFLLNNLGVVPWEIWNYIVGFWPIFLVFAGINIILGQNIFSKFIIGILALVSFGLILAYGLYQVNSPLVNNLPPQITDIIMFIGNLRK